MSRYCGGRDPEPILKAAVHWRDVALLGQGSVFGSSKLWTIDNLKAIDKHFSQNPDTGKNDFLKKLEAQLAACEAEVKQLAAEVMWILLLAPSNVTPKHKRSVFQEVWDWSGEPHPAASEWLTDEVLQGIGSGGRSFNNLRWRELAFFITMLIAFKSLPPNDQRDLFIGGERFAKWLQALPEGNSRQMRHMLTYFFFPDDFERVFSGTDRREIARVFSGKSIAEIKDLSAYDIDLLLRECRTALEKQYGTTELDFYHPPLDTLWGDIDEKLRKIERHHVENAIAQIDEEGIPAKEQSKKYDLIYHGNRYPIKLVAAIAAAEATESDITTDMVPGGEKGTAFKRLIELGFEIVEKRLISELLNAFLAQANGGANLKTKQYEKSYRQLQIRVSFGQGGSAHIPWIAFLAPGQKVSNGFYPVILDYRQDQLLILSYGMSEENNAAGSWRGLHDQSTIDAFYNAKYSRSPERYGKSFVDSSYELSADVDIPGLTKRLDLMIDLYRSQLAGNESENASTAAKTQSETNMSTPTNLIYYGPPGTGKTYKTAEKAVLLCDGKVPEGDRTALLARYRELIAAERINFVTFHQSYSYEDFVEGLRPDLDENGNAESKHGLKLSVKPGAFKAIADRAAAGKGVTSHEAINVEGRGAFKMSLGRSGDDDDAYLFQDAIRNDCVLLGYGGDIDWSDEAYSKFSAILSKWREREPDATGNNPNVQQIYTLRSDMKEGDFVIISDGNKRFRAIGLIDGPYKFVKRERDGFHHQRKVKWLWRSPSGLPREEIYGKHFNQVSAYRLVSEFVKWKALAQFIAGVNADGDNASPEPFVLIIDEINRGNVSKIFGELITLIEADKRSGADEALTVRLPYSHTDFSVPQNLHVIGTMNTADRSIALLDTALRRRFEFEELAPIPSLISDDVEGVDLRAAFQGINDRIEYLYDRDHLIGHAYLQKCKTVAQLNEVMGKRIIPLLVEYFHENWEKVRAVLKETKNDGAFIKRELLAMPISGDEEGLSSQERWRYSINPTFAAADYNQLK